MSIRRTHLSILAESKYSKYGGNPIEFFSVVKCHRILTPEVEMKAKEWMVGAYTMEYNF